MKAAGQCASCLRWRRSSGTILPAVEGCHWIADEEGRSLSLGVQELLQVLATLAAREGLCPGHQPVDAALMPDCYRAADLPLAASGIGQRKAMRQPGS